MVVFALVLLAAAWIYLSWRLWHSRYRASALRGLGLGAAVTWGLPFLGGCLFGTSFGHASARPGLDGGLFAVATYGLMFTPIGLPLGQLAGVIWQRLRQSPATEAVSDTAAL